MAQSRRQDRRRPRRAARLLRLPRRVPGGRGPATRRSSIYGSVAFPHHAAASAATFMTMDLRSSALGSRRQLVWFVGLLALIGAAFWIWGVLVSADRGGALTNAGAALAAGALLAGVG